MAALAPSRHNIIGRVRGSDAWYVVNPLAGHADVLTGEEAARLREGRPDEAGDFDARITVVHQFEKLQANRVAQEGAFANPKIEFLFRHEPREFVARGNTVGEVVVEDLATHERKRIVCDGVFVFAGMQPNLDAFGGAFERDEWGYIQVQADTRTSVPDVFAAGDVRSKPFRQMTTAVSDGTIAAMAIGGELGAWTPPARHEERSRATKVELSEKDVRLLVQSLTHRLESCKNQGKVEPCEDCVAAAARKERLAGVHEGGPQWD
jgi:hypothetical protein